jgi:dipeptidyl-peptidase-3
MLQGTTAYFSSNCTLEDANLVAQLLKHRNMEAYNSRVFKTVENGTPTYEVNLLLAYSVLGTNTLPL